MLPEIGCLELTRGPRKDCEREEMLVERVEGSEDSRAEGTCMNASPGPPGTDRSPPRVPASSLVPW